MLLDESFYLRNVFLRADVLGIAVGVGGKSFLFCNLPPRDIVGSSTLGLTSFRRVLERCRYVPLDIVALSASTLTHHELHPC